MRTRTQRSRGIAREGNTPPCPMRGSSTTERADSSSASRKPRAASTGDDGPISAILRASYARTIAYRTRTEYRI